ncbi:hypothetical protein ACRYWZ_10765 [Agrobacterium deltaense]|uniref:hypothetical protein n=1 Tax=Agrobacterium deltaense TaxID=1183412 RepID=UPI003D98EEAC
MSRGFSGRIVLEIDPKLKARVYSQLALQNMSLKSWFISCANEFLDDDKGCEPELRQLVDPDEKGR